MVACNVKASLCPEAAKRPRWPRLYSLGRPRSCDCIPSLVIDCGPVLQVLGWALTSGIAKAGAHWGTEHVPDLLNVTCLFLQHLDDPGMTVSLIQGGICVTKLSN